MTLHNINETLRIMTNTLQRHVAFNRSEDDDEDDDNNIDALGFLFLSRSWKINVRSILKNKK